MSCLLYHSSLSLHTLCRSCHHCNSSVHFFMCHSDSILIILDRFSLLFFSLLRRIPFTYLLYFHLHHIIKDFQFKFHITLTYDIVVFRSTLNFTSLLPLCFTCLDTCFAILGLMNVSSLVTVFLKSH